MTRATRLLWLVHVPANVALAGLFWLWLGIPDARTWQLGITAILGLVILFGVLWLHGSTFRYFSNTGTTLGAAFRGSLKRLPVFTIWIAAFAACIALLQRWHPAGNSTAVVRWFVAWILMPAALLPLASAAMGGGRTALDVYRSPKYWIWTAVSLGAGIYLPYRLILWAPALKGLTAEAASFAVRWTVAYLAVITAWLTLAYVSSGGIPRFTQSNTTSLPNLRTQSVTNA